jgi:hypothetical protein
MYQYQDAGSVNDVLNVQLNDKQLWQELAPNASTVRDRHDCQICPVPFVPRKHARPVSALRDAD